MAIKFLGESAFPAYIGLSTDIVSGSVIGAGLIGKTIYTTDDKSWYIVVEASGSSFYTQPFVMPALET